MAQVFWVEFLFLEKFIKCDITNTTGPSKYNSPNFTHE